MYSQNLEEQFILEYFGDCRLNLLDIGANDGKTFSNSFALIKKGWRAVLVEPSNAAFNKLSDLHKDNSNVTIVNSAIGKERMKMILHESGSHLKDKSDFALLSSLSDTEIIKWAKSGIEFTSYEVPVIPYSDIKNDYDFITIDAEGYDLDILKQVDLTPTQLLCIEWNSIQSKKDEILKYTSAFGMNKIIYQSPENLLICR